MSDTTSYPPSERITSSEHVSSERITIQMPGATIEGPARLGPVTDPGAVAAAVQRWAATLYERDPAKRALIDARVLRDPNLRDPNAAVTSLRKAAA